MRVTTSDRYGPAPGRLVEFAPSAATLAVADGTPPSPVPPSFNQRFHLAGAGRRPTGGPRHWLACAVELPGRVDPRTLRDALGFWLRRHESLRGGFRAGAPGPDGAPGPGGVPERFMAPERFVVPAEKTELEVRDLGAHPDPEALRALLTARLNAACHPLRWPPWLFAAVLRPGGATVLCGFDHSTADGYSLALAAHELPASYAAHAAGAVPRLPAAGSYVDYCAEEQRSARPPGPDDPRLRGWAEFFRACGGTTPSFPLELGARPGAPEPPGSECRRLLDAAAAEALERRCRAAGGSPFAGVLAAFGRAAHRLGGPPVLRLCAPLHTRHEERWRHAVGWFTTVAPVTLDVTGVRGLADGVPRARDAFRRARELAGCPVAQVVPALGAEFRRSRNDVFMVSYLDYRRLPGGDAPVARAAHHVSGVSPADDAQFWVSRTHRGLFLRARYPGTATAGPTVRALADALGAELARPD